MIISETHVNETNNHLISEEEFTQPFTDNIGELFKSLQQEHGRCMGKIYFGPVDRHIGWIFQKRKPYSDDRETYLHEVWVVLHKRRPIISKSYDYKYIDRKTYDRHVQDRRR